MKSLSRFVALATMLTSLALVALLSTSCDDDATPAGGTTSGGGDAGGANPADGGGTSTADSGGTGTDDGGGTNTADSGACNTLVNDGTDVPEQAMTGTPPAMTGGGPIADGTYLLTAREDWQGSCNCLERRKVVIAGNQVQIVTKSDGKPEEHISATVTYAGTELTYLFTCGAPAQVGQSFSLQYTFSAGAPSTYKTYETRGGKSQVETFTKQ